MNGFPRGSVAKNPPANARATGDACLIAESGRSSGGGNGRLLQHSFWNKFKDRGIWQATVHGDTESDMIELLTFSLP